MPKWRNWHTRYVQGVVRISSWGFDSPLRHQFCESKIDPEENANCNEKEQFALTKDLSQAEGP